MNPSFSDKTHEVALPLQSVFMRDPSALELRKDWGVGLNRMEGPILIHFGKLKASVDYRVA